MNNTTYQQEIDDAFLNQIYWTINRLISNDIWIPRFEISKYWADFEIFYNRELPGSIRIYYYPDKQKFTLDVSNLNYSHYAIIICYLLNIEPENFNNEKSYRAGNYTIHSFCLWGQDINIAYDPLSTKINPICSIEYTPHDNYIGKEGTYFDLFNQI